MIGLDRKAREVELGPLHDDEGALVVPARRIGYDTLIIPVGSQVNDFGTPGAAEHAISLDSVAAELHHSTRELIAFGMDRLRADRDIRITLVEAGPRVLPALPEKLSEGAEALLRKLRVDVRTGER